MKTLKELVEHVAAHSASISALPRREFDFTSDYTVFWLAARAIPFDGLNSTGDLSEMLYRVIGRSIQVLGGDHCAGFEWIGHMNSDQLPVSNRFDESISLAHYLTNETDETYRAGQLQFSLHEQKNGYTTVVAYDAPDEEMAVQVLFVFNIY